MEAAERGEALVHAPVRADELRRRGLPVEGDWAYAPEWLEELRASFERSLDAADPLDPGVGALFDLGRNPRVAQRLPLVIDQPDLNARAADIDADEIRRMRLSERSQSQSFRHGVVPWVRCSPQYTCLQAREQSRRDR
jgi:hypothetical protein